MNLPNDRKDNDMDDNVSWAPEVIADASGKWTGNGLRFATRDEAECWARDLSGRWMMVRDTRAVASSEPVNYRYVDGKLFDVKEAS